MNTSLTNLITTTATVLAMTSSAFAAQPSKPVQLNDNGCPCTPFEQGTRLTSCESFPPAYNIPARIEVRCSWDVFLTGSFIYWFANEEGLDLGYNTATTGGVTILPANNGLKVAQGGDWLPGFKVGIGANFDIDKWVGYAEYTWLHGSTTNSMNAGTDTRGTPVIVLGTWYNQKTADPLDHTASNLSSKWKIKLDMLDVLLSRPFYEGRNLTINPFFGARAMWIRQNLRLSATTTNAPANPVISHNQSRSWALGPRAGMQSHWLVGLGFRLEGDAGAALLFQRYTKVAHRSDALNATADGAAESLHYTNYGALRPVMDMGLGIGWGSYLDCQNFYLDIAANYDFIYMWGQNVIRHLADDYNYGVDGACSDLFFQGLTLTVRFDF